MHSSSKNLGVGDRAIIINAHHVENIGKEVLIEKISDDVELKIPGLLGTVYNKKREIAAYVSDNILISKHELLGTSQIENGWIPLKNLMPLKGDFKEEEEVEDVLLSLSHN